MWRTSSLWSLSAALMLALGAGPGCVSRTDDSFSMESDHRAQERAGEGDEEWSERAAGAAGAVGRGVKTGASAVGRGLGTAYSGVTGGFREPGPDAEFGPQPRNTAQIVKKHFVRVLHYDPAKTRFKIGSPQKAWMNDGILRGGGVVWTGWLVDVDLEILGWQRREKSVVVRIRDGDVIEVHDDETLIGRVRPRSADPDDSGSAKDDRWAKRR